MRLYYFTILMFQLINFRVFCALSSHIQIPIQNLNFLINHTSQAFLNLIIYQELQREHQIDIIRSIKKYVFIMYNCLHRKWDVRVLPCFFLYVVRWGFDHFKDQAIALKDLRKSSFSRYSNPTWFVVVDADARLLRFLVIFTTFTWRTLFVWSIHQYTDGAES